MELRGNNAQRGDGAYYPKLQGDAANYEQLRGNCAFEPTLGTSIEPSGDTIPRNRGTIQKIDTYPKALRIKEYD